MRNSILTEFVVAIYHSGRRSVARNACSVSGQLGDSQSSCVRFLLHISELTMQRILIVEDEQKTGRYLQQGLVEEAISRSL